MITVLQVFVLVEVEQPWVFALCYWVDSDDDEPNFSQLNYIYC